MRILFIALVLCVGVSACGPVRVRTVEPARSLPTATERMLMRTADDPC